MLFVIVLSGCGASQSKYVTKDDLYSLKQDNIMRDESTTKDITNLIDKWSKLENKINTLEKQLPELKTLKEDKERLESLSKDTTNIASNFASSISKLDKRMTILEDQVTNLIVAVAKLQGNQENIKGDQFDKIESIINSNTPKNTSNVIASWEGNSAKTTEPFIITKAPWAVIWSAKSNIDESVSALCHFSIYVMRAGEENVSIIANTNQGNDISYVYEPGTFHLIINPIYVDWTIEVRELK